MHYRKRFDYANYVRCLADDVWEDVDDDDDDDDEQAAEDNEDMDVDKMQLRKPGRNYRNQVVRDLSHFGNSIQMNCVFVIFLLHNTDIHSNAAVWMSVHRMPVLYQNG